MPRAAIVLALILVAFVATSSYTSRTSQASHRNPMAYVVNEAALPFAPLAGATAYWGVEKGAGWRIEVPNDWNGDLVLWAHGFVPGNIPTLFVQNPAFGLRNHLIANGYAWAASSYRQNGYVPGVGAEDTFDLLKLFPHAAGRFHDNGPGNSGKPDRVYIVGVSMGGHVTGYAIERWPDAFVGALPLCGVMGDNELFDFYHDVYIVAETLVGNGPGVPSPPDYATVGSVATRAQLGAPYPAVLNATGETFKQIIKNRTGGERPAFTQGWLGPNGGNFIFGVAFASTATENSDTIYQFDDNPALSAAEQDFNDNVPRFPFEHSARNPQGIHSETVDSPAIHGRIKIPVLTLHTLGELFVPFSMEQIYAMDVAARGRSDLLVQRAIRSVLHCGFTPAEVTGAFDDLVDWVVNGVKPAGDDVLDPATVADPLYGCQFTSVTRPPIPACP